MRVIVTFAAVLVALFGPGLRRSRRRPIVTLTSPEPWIEIDLTDPDPAGPASLVLMRLTLHNKRGRDTAQDVEMFARVTYQGPQQGSWTTFLVADQAHLNFDDPIAGPGRSTATVPSGFARDVNLATILDLDGEYEVAHGRVGRLALYPPQLARDALLWAGRTYEVAIVATGSNFDARRYWGTFSDQRTDQREDHHDRLEGLRPRQGVTNSQATSRTTRVGGYLSRPPRAHQAGRQVQTPRQRRATPCVLSGIATSSVPLRL